MRLTAVAHIALALLLDGRELLAGRPGVTAPAVNAVVVHDRDDARLRQVQHSPGDDFMASGAISLFQVEQVITEGRRVGGEPGGRHQQPMREQVGQRFAGHWLGPIRGDAEPFEQGSLLMLADLVGNCPLVPLLGRLGAEENLLPAARPMRPAALFLPAVQADDHPQVPLGQRDGVYRRLGHAGGPAANAGLKTGDVIFSVDGQPVNDMQSLNYRIATHKPGDVVRVHAHLGKQASDISLTLALPPENPPRDLQSIGGRNPLTGAKVENLSPAVATELQMPLMANGVAIVSVTAGTPSGGYGFQPGDVVRGVNGVEMHSVSELQRALSSTRHWELVIDRGGQRLTLTVDG